METHYFECTCSDFGHVFRFCFDSVDGDIWIEVQLAPYGPWWARLWRYAKNAWKYVTGRQVSYGHYDTTILRLDDYDKIRDLLNRSEMTKAGHLSRAREQALRVQ